VIGAGGIGAFLEYALTCADVRVVAVDASPERLAVARRLGAVDTVKANDAAGVTAALAELGFVPTLVYEVTGTDAGFEAAVAVVSPGGRLVTVGIAKQPIAIDARRVTTKEIEIVGTNALIGSEDVPEAARLLAMDPETWQDVAPRAIPLDRVVADGIMPMIEGDAKQIKLLVDPWIASARDTAMVRW
jgi:threonine dehydrogenase-like Zn-dependent dehydrogenase